MCINCIVKQVAVIIASAGVTIYALNTVASCLKKNTQNTQVSCEKASVPETPVVKQQYVMIEGILKDPSVVKRNISRTACVACNNQEAEIKYSIAVYANNNGGDFRSKIFHNAGENIYIITVCEGCRDEIFAMADSIKRGGINKRIIATFYDAEGKDTGVAVNYNRLKPDPNQLCPYPDIPKCVYSAVCKHCNMYRTKYSIFIKTADCKTDECEQSFVCVDCHQKLLHAPGNIFPLDSDGYRLYDDIDVFTFEHTLPVGSKIRESVIGAGIDTSLIPTKRQRMYPDIHGVHYSN